MSEPAQPEIEVSDDREAGRYVITLDGEPAGFARGKWY
jgi:hypothetical protein